MIRHFFAIFTAAALFVACRKESLSATHYLADGEVSRSVSIHQALFIYDSTALRDSLEFVDPPTGRLYRWTVLPDSMGVHITGDYLHGEPVISFDQSGVYDLSAKIYDSATNKLLAHTKTFTIDVTTDTLYPSSNIPVTDQLTISCYSYGHGTNDTAALDYGFFLTMVTTNSYGAASVIPWQLTSSNGIRIAFADTTSLSTWPFNPYGTANLPITTYISVQGIPVDNSEPFSVVWLDHTYSGTISQPLPGSLSFTWDNTGPVKIQQGGMIQ